MPPTRMARADRLTERTVTGEAMSPAWPATAAAAGEGEVGEEHAAVIARVMQRVERIPHVDPPTCAAAEATLAASARRLAPTGVARVG